MMSNDDSSGSELYPGSVPSGTSQAAAFHFDWGLDFCCFVCFCFCFFSHASVELEHEG